MHIAPINVSTLLLITRALLADYFAQGTYIEVGDSAVKLSGLLHDALLHPMLGCSIPS